MNATHDREDGQVTPALLMAVIGAFALAMIFVVVARGEDQGARSDTAADAAALAAGREYQRHTGTFLAPAVDVALQQLGTHAPLTAAAAAGQYADTNGARVVSARLLGYDPVQLEWRYQVEVEQSDVIEAGGRDYEQSNSISTVAVRAVGGLCRSAEGGLTGFESLGECVGPAELILRCTAERTGNPLPGKPCPKPPEVLNAFEAEIRLVN